METAIEIFRVVSRRKWVILVTTLVTCAVVTVGTLVMPPTYSATNTLRVAQAHGGSMEYVDYRYAERLMNTQVEILRSRPILEETIRRLGLGMMPKDLAARTRVEVLPETELIQITVDDSNPWRARDIANTLAGLLMEQSQVLYSGGSKSAREILEEQLAVIEGSLEEDRQSLEAFMSRAGSSEAEIAALSKKIALEEQAYAMLLPQYEQARVQEAVRANSITVVEAAIEPEAPSSPNKKLNIMLGGLVGLGGGLGLAFLFENLSGTLAAQRLPSLRKRRTGEAVNQERERVPVSMDELGLQARIAIALKGAGIESAEDLLQKDDVELLAIRGLGAKSLEQVRASLKDRGLV
jgi:uncharacterized protein involved in exopolysaccharide biosynthesis